MVGIASAAIYSILVPISEDTGLTLGDLNAGTGYMVSIQSSSYPCLQLTVRSFSFLDGAA